MAVVHNLKVALSRSCLRVHTRLCPTARLCPTGGVTMRYQHEDYDWVRLFDWASLLQDDALGLLADIAEQIALEDIFDFSAGDGQGGGIGSG
jgi:hypothetical protein